MRDLVYTIVGLSLVASVTVGSLSYFQGSEAENGKTAALVVTRLTANAVAVQRYREANGRYPAAFAPADPTSGAGVDGERLADNVGGLGFLLQPALVDGERWRQLEDAETAYLCYELPASDSSRALLQIALGKIGRGFVSGACGVPYPPDSNVTVYSLPLGSR